MEVEATPDKKQPPLWGVQQNRATTPIVSHNGQTPRSEKALKMRAKPSPVKVRNLTPSQKLNSQYHSDYYRDKAYCIENHLDLTEYRIGMGRAKKPKKPSTLAQRAYQKALRDRRRQAKAVPFGLTPPVASTSPTPPSIAAMLKKPPPTPPVPPSTSAANPPPPSMASTPWASTPPTTSRKAVLANMTPEQKADVFASKKRKVNGYGSLVKTLHNHSETMKNNSETMKKDSETLERMVANLDSAEDDMQAMIYETVELEMEEEVRPANLLNRFSNIATTPSVAAPSIVNPSVANNPSKDLKTAYERTCHELKGHFVSLNNLINEAEAGVPCTLSKDVAVKLMSDIDSVHIAGTEQQKKDLHEQKRNVLTIPLKELCEKCNVEVDWDYYDL